MLCLAYNLLLLLFGALYPFTLLVFYGFVAYCLTPQMLCVWLETSKCDLVNGKCGRRKKKNIARLKTSLHTRHTHTPKKKFICMPHSSNKRFLCPLPKNVSILCLPGYLPYPNFHTRTTFGVPFLCPFLSSVVPFGCIE